MAALKGNVKYFIDEPTVKGVKECVQSNIRHNGKYGHAALLLLSGTGHKHIISGRPVLP
jgi:hypothetical protein